MGVLDDKVAVVTGSARGIGRATAELLTEHGAKVVINDLDADAADDAAGEIGRLQAEVERLLGLGFSIDGDRLTRLPAGYPADSPRGELLRHKSLHATRRWDPSDWLHDRRALDRVRDAWRELHALNAWLADNVGATAKEPRRR